MATRNGHEIRLKEPPKKLEEKKFLLARALANPLDDRKDDELMEWLKLTSKQYTEIVTDPGFMEPVLKEMQQNLRGSTLLHVMKALTRSVQKGSTTAARTVVEIAKTFETGGGKASPEDEKIAQMLDSEIDQQIRMLHEEAYPGDVMLESGQVVPVEFEDVTYEDGDPSGPPEINEVKSL